MSSRRSASLYIFLGLLLIAGIFMFSFKGQLLSYLSGRVFGAETAGEEAVVNASAASVINLDILKKPQFQNLKNHVLYFDFNHVGKVVNKAVGASAQPPVWQPVYLGNANPFLVKEKAQATTTKATTTSEKK